MSVEPLSSSRRDHVPSIVGMQQHDLQVAGAWAVTPPVFFDDRGSFVSTYVDHDHRAIAGHELFGVAQVSFSRSSAGVVRGVHFAATPPGQAKYVWCSYGTVLDVVVDLRRGSPTFGVWDSVLLEATAGTAVYLPVGVGHAFLALEDNSSMTYLLSASYIPANELALSVHDPQLALDPQMRASNAMSHRDRGAPTLAELDEAGRLPDYRTCLRLELELATVTP